MEEKEQNSYQVFPGSKKILVVGGGISGMTTAIEAAEVGYEVVLVEKEEYLGGHAIEMNQYFPKLCPPYCGMEINFRRIKQNSRIKVLTGTQLKAVEGEEGNFEVNLITAPRFVNDKCTLCGDCTTVCPEERKNSFNQDMDFTKAIYLPHDLAFPALYTIDVDACRGESCNKCVEVCNYHAIDLKAKPIETSLEVGSVVYATGWKAYDANKLDSLLYGQHPDVITSLMMERLAAPNGPTAGMIQCPSDGRAPEKIAFVQCAGSRDHNHLAYCSGVCCSASMKQALNLAEVLPDAKISIHYIDLRVTGRNEAFLNRVEENKSIALLKGKVASILKDSDGGLKLMAEDVLSGKKKIYTADLVVLATGIIPSGIITDNFSVQSDYETPAELPAGMYLAGCAGKPLDISASLKQATGVALKAIASLKTADK